MTKDFSISEALAWGWKTLKSHSMLIYQVILTLFALQVANAIVNRVLAHTALGFVAAAVIVVAEAVLGVGATIITLRLAKGEHAHYGDMIPTWTLFWRYIFASLLAGLITFIPIAIAGIICLAAFFALPFGANIAVCIVVGVIGFIVAVYFALRYAFVKLAPLDGHGITESLGKSAALTEGRKWHLLLFVLAIIGINILGAIALLIGLLVSIPVTMLAYAHLYVRLAK